MAYSCVAHLKACSGHQHCVKINSIYAHACNNTHPLRGALATESYVTASNTGNKSRREAGAKTSFSNVALETQSTR